MLTRSCQKTSQSKTDWEPGCKFEGGGKESGKKVRISAWLKGEFKKQRQKHKIVEECVVWCEKPNNALQIGEMYK